MPSEVKFPGKTTGTAVLSEVQVREAVVSGGSEFNTVRTGG